MAGGCWISRTERRGYPTISPFKHCCAPKILSFRFVSRTKNFILNTIISGKALHCRLVDTEDGRQKFEDLRVDWRAYYDERERE
jgi:hypothetical protein